MRTKAILLSALTALAVLATPALAQDVRPHGVMPAQEERGRERQALRPIREVIESLRDRHGGEYVGHWVEGGARPIYVIRWRMPDGVTIREFRVDAGR
ncbi:MAG TPA: hypothetical protein DHW63_03330 [Hyphomonadaceae bacterium]|jgi:hypothetical protein|nr:hypothetical protein [Hyphomonadaceae bacterium]